MLNDLTDVPGIHVLENGHLVSRVADFVMYSVEAEFIDRVVAEYGPCMSALFRLLFGVRFADTQADLGSDEGWRDCIWTDISQSP